jgi:uncharacterized protein
MFRYLNKQIDLNSLDKYTKSELEKTKLILNTLIDKNIFFAKRREFQKPIYKEAFISLAPVHACNLKCKYCFAQHGNNYQDRDIKFTKDSLRKSLRYIYLEYFKDIYKFRFDFVSGGEPLLAFDMVQEVVAFCNEMKENHNKVTKIWLCTNATLISQQILKYLNSKGINIGISLDGPKMENDRYRIYKNGKSTYNKVINNMIYIRNSNGLSNNLKSIWGLVVITNQTKSLIDIIKHHKEVGFSSVQMKIVRSNNKDYEINLDNINHIKNLYEELVSFFKKNIINNDTSYLKMILNDNDYFGKIIRRLILRYTVINRCQAGKNKVSITANGDMYPCDSFVGNKEFQIGNAIRNELYENVFSDIYTYNRSTCTDCWARYVCGGDCFHNSYLKNGDIQQPDIAYCDLERHLIQLAIVLLCNINLYNPTCFNDLERTLSIRNRLEKL